MPSARSTTVRDLRRSNRARTLWELYLNGPLTYQGVARAAGVSLATVSNVMSDLVRTGCVAEVGSEESNGGRPRGLFHINPDFGHVIGVDVGETAVMVELFDLGMHVRASHRSVTEDARLSPDDLVDHVIEGIDAVVAEAGIDEESILGVGVGVPGLVERVPVDAAAGDPDTPCPGDTEAVLYGQSIGWGDVPIERMLRARTSLPLLVDNGANTLGQAERWFGAARGSDNAVVVLLGSGVGASIARGGEGGASFAGELGHTTVVAGGKQCVCGARGCLEAYAGADAIVATYDRLTERDQATSPSDVEDRMRAILAADDSDPAAAQAIDELVDYLGAGLGTIVNLFTPDRIVLGGWLGDALGQGLLERIHAAIGRTALARPFERVASVPAALGTDAVALGAATLPVAEFLGSGGVERVLPLHGSATA